LTSQGLIACQSDSTRSALVEVLCETDFVAKTDRFKEFSEYVCNFFFDKGEVNGEEMEDRRLSTVGAT
jgi:translation elongation factor EF-Ts